MNTRDKLAAVFRSVAWLEPLTASSNPRREVFEWAAFEDDVIDALLASDVLNHLRAEAWDEGMEWGRGNHLAPGNGPRGYAANPYRIERDGDTR